MGLYQNRIVVKVGTSTLTNDVGKSDLRAMDNLARVLSDIQNMGYEVILVSSGAIAVGCNKLGMKTKLQAAELATAQGIDTIITNGKNTEAIYNIVKGFGAGTLFKGKQR